jgi:predicted PurR-regulated permease PerM
MNDEAERLSQMAFYGVVLLVCWMAFLIVRPFLVEIGWAVVLAICLDPLRIRLGRRFGHTRTALVLALGAGLLLVLPAVLVATAVVTEGRPAVAHLQAQLQSGGGAAASLHQAWEWARQRAPFLPPEEEAIATVTGSIGKMAEFAAGQAGGLLRGVVEFLFALFITLTILFFLLRDAEAGARAVRRILPFGRAQNERLITLTSDLVMASVTASITVSAIQGIVGGITFALLGFSGAALWGVMMFILAFLPLIGATLVWLPAALWLALSGSIVKGLILAAVGLVILGNVDNVVRPVLLSGRSQMNTLVLILSLLGGVGAFGFIGIVLGPLVAALLTALVESYATEPSEPQTAT